jgi:hypothetical protein
LYPAHFSASWSVLSSDSGNKGELVTPLMPNPSR